MVENPQDKALAIVQSEQDKRMRCLTALFDRLDAKMDFLFYALIGVTVAELTVMVIGFSAVLATLD